MRRIAWLTLLAFACLACEGKDSKWPEHFKPAEFACNHCGEVKAHPELLAKLEKLRALAGDQPVYINSGYRCREHNEDVGGAEGSMHVSGRAADIRVKDKSPREVYSLAKKAKFPGIGLYPRHVHVDVREHGEAEWRGDY